MTRFALAFDPIDLNSCGRAGTEASRYCGCEVSDQIPLFPSVLIKLLMLVASAG